MFLVGVCFLAGCDRSAGNAAESHNLERQVRAAELQRDALKEELEQLRAQDAAAAVGSREAELAATLDAVRAAHDENAALQHEYNEFKSRYPIRK